jgi:CheY-like chemotaxis protein
MESLKILLIEDDPADQKLIRYSLNNQAMDSDIIIVNSGEEGLDYLHRKGLYQDYCLQPDIILLDLNMPGMGGKEFLRVVKSDESTKHIPVVVLTTSSSESDIIDSYKLQASGYVKKPLAIEELTRIMNGIESYWGTVCKRPSAEDYFGDR